MHRSAHRSREALEADLTEGSAIQVECWGCPDAEHLNIRAIPIEDRHSSGRAQLNITCRDIKPLSFSDLPGDLHPWAVMQCPVRLAFQQCVKNRLEQILAARGLQNGNSFVGTLMEGGIAHHDPQLIGELRPQLRQDRVEGPASLAGGIEKLDQGNRRILSAERCGTRAQQNRIEIRNLGRPPGRPPGPQ